MTRKTVMVDSKGFVTVDGVKLGKVVERPDGVCLQVCDKNKHRSRDRGTRLIEVHIQELAKQLTSEGEK